MEFENLSNSVSELTENVANLENSVSTLKNTYENISASEMQITHMRSKTN